MSFGLEILSFRGTLLNIWRFVMKPGDLVRKGDTVGLVVKVMWANDIRWLKLQGQKDFVSEIGWRVVSESK
jgi:hypothetical protein